LLSFDYSFYILLTEQKAFVKPFSEVVTYI